MEAQDRVKTRVTLDSSRVRKRLDASVSSIAAPTGPVTDERQLIATVEGGATRMQDGRAASRLVIPVPELPLPAAHISAEDAAAAASILDDLRGGSRPSSSTVRHVIAPTAAAAVAPPPGPSTAAAPPIAPTRRRRDESDHLLAAQLFKPSQKRVRSDGAAAPLLLRSRAGAAAGEDVTMDSFDRVPVDEYGAAMLRGMGVEDEVVDAVTGAAEGGDDVGLTARPKELKKYGLGAKVSAEAAGILALDAAAREEGRMKRPGEVSRVASMLALTGHTAGAQTGQVVTARVVPDRYPGLVDLAVVRMAADTQAVLPTREAVDVSERVGVVTDVENVPGLEKCRVRILTPGATRGATDAETVCVIVPKARAMPVLAPDGTAAESATAAALTTEERAQAAELQSIQRGILQRAQKVAEAAAEVAAAAAAAAAAATAEKRKLEEAAAAAAEAEVSTAAEAPTTNVSNGSSSSAWLMERIRVRIVDEKVWSSRYHLVKAVVLDVPTPRTCTLSIEREDGSEKVVHDVADRELETALPKPGGAVVLLRGDMRGTRGELVERDSRSAIARVQTRGGDVIQVPLDDVAEYVPDARREQRREDRRR